MFWKKIGWIPGNEFTERGGIIMNLKGRHFLTLKDYTPEEIAYLLELSADLKKKKKEGPSWFEKTFNKLSNEIFSDDDMK